MKKHIVIAGAGHGGLVAGAYLAECGYAVEIFEKLRREELGYDWHDTIDNTTFETAGITNIDAKDIHYRLDNVYYPPSLKAAVVIPDTPKELLQFEVERKVIYKYLIDNAINKGVIIHYEQEVTGPLIIDGKVNGLIVSGKEIKADMVIDSAGMHTPVLANLPKSYNIYADYSDNDIFHIYRAYFNLVESAEIINPARFNVYFKFLNLRGITWFKIVDGMADVLIGGVDSLDYDEVNRVLDKLRQVQKGIGKSLLRGGQIKEIPLKSTFTLMVGDNYAAIGDAVSMPLPLNGSGITNSVVAGKMLAETIIEADNKNAGYDIAALWGYQTKYFNKIGAKMAGVYLMKNCLLNYSESALNFLFEKKILTAKELGAGTLGKEIELTKADVLDKIKRGFSRPISLLKLKNAAVSARTVKQFALTISEKYDLVKVEQWRKQLEKMLK